VYFWVKEKIMDKAIRNALAIEAVRLFKEPVIVMNDYDYKEFIKHLESTITNFKEGDNPKYMGVPIQINKYMERGKMYVYDDAIRLP